MQCSDWERAQDADPVIKRMTSLLEKHSDVAPTKEQLTPELAEVKYLCQHWNLQEIINGVVKRVMSDLIEQKVYARLVLAAMRIELFKRVHGHEAGHFGYSKIYPLFSEQFFWHGMSIDIRNWLKCCALCQRIKLGVRKVRYSLVQETEGAPMERCGIDLSGPWPLCEEGDQYLCVLQDYFSK